MSFRKEKLQQFESIFKASKDKIKSFDGCKHVELLNDVHHPTIFFTYSHWESEAHLEIYRQSELFKSTWAKTKVLFDKQPEVWTLQVKVNSID